MQKDTFISIPQLYCFLQNFIVCEVSSNFLIQLKPASAGRSNTEYLGFMVLYTVVSFYFKYPSIHFPEGSFAAEAVNVLKASNAIISVRIFEHFFINIIIKLILSLKRSVHTNRGYYYLFRSACANKPNWAFYFLPHSCILVDCPDFLL